jgi:hypothetical protein
MKSKRKEVKKYNIGGYLQAGLGTAQTLYGLSQIPGAKAEFERAQAAAPSLETPSQYYENYKNAYDSEIARMENDAIQSNLASSIQALQGAGGRALVGGLGNANQIANTQQQQMLGRERNIRLQAGQQLAAAEAATIGRKEIRSQSEIAMANKGYQAALGNVGSGIGSIGTGLMYGMRGDDNPFKAAVDSEKFIGMDEYNGLFNEYLDTRNNSSVIPPPPADTQSADTQSVPSNPDLATEATKNTTNDMLEQARAEERLNRSRTRNANGFNFAENPVPAAPPQRFVNIEPQGHLEGVVGNMYNSGWVNEQFKYFEGQPQIPANQFDESMLGPNQTYLKVGETVFIRDMSPQQLYERELGKKLRSLGKNFLTGFGMQQTVPYMKKQGGMMTDGEFNHDTNPIDIVQGGVKVGEATGQEVILNPKQAASIAKESSFARELFKRFAKNAKKNK